MIEETVEIPTRDGFATTFICHPERDGPHPLVLFFMDAPGIREELRDMVRRLASVGYYVMLPNLYYRSGVMELADLPPLEPDAARDRMFGLMNSIGIPEVMADSDALIAYADGQAAASDGPIGCVGYCMSGQYAVNLAASYPARVAAAASIHGTMLVTDRPDSPHVAASKGTAELYFACAETDRWAPMETVEALSQSLAAAGVAAEVEIYPGAEHGFVFPQRALYHRSSAERHWERLFSLYRRRLG
ncbi:MAG: dienelactone hydrolase family protein [Phenylobacterium sp.]|uniref:dienelactone hydrolase family protein n=1 Tax=Phenylobacterium sp. TaxID=1871053 RepID=UPI00391C50E1